MTLAAPLQGTVHHNALWACVSAYHSGVILPRYCSSISLCCADTSVTGSLLPTLHTISPLSYSGKSEDWHDRVALGFTADRIETRQYSKISIADRRLREISYWACCLSSGRQRPRNETPIRDSNLVDSASSIRLSQRLSHACLSINKSIL